MTHPERLGAVVIAALAVSIVSTAQESPKKRPSDNAIEAPQRCPSQKTQKKPMLFDALRVSTADAAREAAKEKTGSQALEKAPAAADSEVLEFRPQSRESHATGTSVKSPPPKVHGEVYSAFAPAHSGTHRSGAGVGAGSKGGKTNLYVEAGQTRSTSATPH